MILEESGYTEMWQADRSADAPGRLENLKELVRSMEEFDSMGGFLEHISLVMDTADESSQDAVSMRRAMLVSHRMAERVSWCRIALRRRRR